MTSFRVAREAHWSEDFTMQRLSSRFFLYQCHLLKYRNHSSPFGNRNTQSSNVRCNLEQSPDFSPNGPCWKLNCVSTSSQRCNEWSNLAERSAGRGGHIRNTGHLQSNIVKCADWSSRIVIQLHIEGCQATNNDRICSSEDHTRIDFTNSFQVIKVWIITRQAQSWKWHHIEFMKCHTTQWCGNAHHGF